MVRMRAFSKQEAPLPRLGYLSKFSILLSAPPSVLHGGMCPNYKACVLKNSLNANFWTFYIGCFQFMGELLETMLLS